MSRRPVFSSTGAALAVLSLISPTPAQDAPEAGTPAAAQLLDKACEKMLALGRGHFSTVEEQDNALIRRTGMAGGAGEAEVDGRWHDDAVWASLDGGEVLLTGGRCFAKTEDGDWILRQDTLPSGDEIPFVLQPRLLFQLLLDLPAEARRVRNVEATEVKNKPLTILGLTLEGDHGRNFAAAGVIPGMRSPVMQAIRMGGGAAFAMPQPDVTIDLALYVADDGGVHRIRAKAYKEGGLPGNIRIGLGGPGGDIEIEEEEEEEPEKKSGELRYKKGLPLRRLGKDQSMMYCRVEFKNHGRADLPELDSRAKRLAGIK